jgi:hypothetical protein
MYALVRSLSTRELFVRQTPVLIGSLAIAEIFYKFGSFLLEAVAFLVTWFLLDALTDLVSGRSRFRVRSDR